MGDDKTSQRLPGVVQQSQTDGDLPAAVVNAADGPRRGHLAKQVWRAVGVVLAIAALAFVLAALWRDREAILQWRPDWRGWFWLGSAVLFYSVANLFLIRAWGRMLQQFARRRSPGPELFAIYARSQIAKYIPGNVAHLAYRHFLGRQLGYANGPLVAAALFELALLLLVAGVIAVIGGVLPAMVHVAGSVALDRWWLLAAVFSVTLSGFAFYRWVWPWLVGRMNIPGSVVVRVAHLIVPVLSYALFFAVSGLALGFVVKAVDPPSTLSFSWVTAVFAVTWLVGVVAPGAPSGLGIREASLIMLMQPGTGVPLAVLIAILLRLVTVVGDVLVFGLGHAMRIRPKLYRGDRLEDDR